MLTMVCARIWPGSPLNPHLAFTFDLMEWADALLLECQVAVSDFCAAIAYKCSFSNIKVLSNDCIYMKLIVFI